VASVTLSGTVVDQSGAVLDGASVTAAQPATGFSRAATTDARGNYSFDQLAPGTYTITAWDERNLCQLRHAEPAQHRAGAKHRAAARSAHLG
jgi:protocatechuate 3,4-dioxygenase beta subunit